jgi:hypothetical protein
MDPIAAPGTAPYYQRPGGQDGTLLSLYWRAYSFYGYLVRTCSELAERDFKLVTLLVTLCRWAHYLHREALWIDHLRQVTE